MLHPLLKGKTILELLKIWFEILMPVVGWDKSKGMISHYFWNQLDFKSLEKGTTNSLKSQCYPEKEQKSWR